MDLFDEKIDELLAKHLAGESSPEEAEAVARWLSEAPERSQYFEQLKWLWKRSADGLPAPTREVDTEAALQRVKARLKSGPGMTVQLTAKFWMRAAAVAVLALAAVYWWGREPARAPVTIAAGFSDLTDTLSDGSVIALRERSGLTLAAAFNRKERRMQLKGEAFFKVAPDTSKPFIVEVRELEVTVVGTAFNVDNASDPSRIVVTVTEGKVLVSSGDKSLLLHPGEGAVYERESGALTPLAATPEQTVPGAARRLFRFDATPLDTVIRQVNEAYHINITLKNRNLGKCLLTARYNDLPLERLLELIADSFSLTITQTRNGYALDGPGCGGN